MASRRRKSPGSRWWRGGRWLWLVCGSGRRYAAVVVPPRSAGRSCPGCRTKACRVNIPNVEVLRGQVRRDRAGRGGGGSVPGRAGSDRRSWPPRGYIRSASAPSRFRSPATDDATGDDATGDDAAARPGRCRPLAPARACRPGRTPPRPRTTGAGGPARDTHTPAPTATHATTTAVTTTTHHTANHLHPPARPAVGPEPTNKEAARDTHGRCPAPPRARRFPRRTPQARRQMDGGTRTGPTAADRPRHDYPAHSLSSGCNTEHGSTVGAS